MEYKRICLICRAVWGNLDGKPLKTFCGSCIKQMRNQTYLVKWSKQKEARKNADRIRTNQTG